MPEEHWAAHGGVQACDSCHARKVKCDRQDPCSNCIAAKSQCLRNRHKRTPRPKVRTDEKIQALVQRLSSLEDSVRSQEPPRASTLPPLLAPENGTPSGTLSPERPSKRKRTGSSAGGTVSTMTPEVDTAQQTTHEARNLIQKELSSNGLFSGHQRSVLETALSFINHLSHVPVTTTVDNSTFDKTMHTPTDLSEGEILNIILRTEVKHSYSTTIHFDSVDHLPPKAIERYALALLEGTADEKTENLYKVIIHFKAAVVLYNSQMQGPKSAAVQKQIRQKEYHHITAALTALDAVSFLTPPSLLLVQALITGAMMMQIVGNPASCWELVAHASRTIVALGYHTISDTQPKTDLEEEINVAVAWCAHFDSCMSLLLLRPRSLPPLQVHAASLTRTDPMNPILVFENISMQMIPVHYSILQLTHDSGPKSSIPLKREVAWLRKQMSDISDMMNKGRPDHLLDTIPDILLHWKCLEFKFFSTRTSVHRLSPTVTTDPLEREECLQSARKALECLKVIESVSKSLGHFIEGYDPYLAWTMLSYPLCPFFVVFCNVVGTSDARDFTLLQDVTDGISSLVTENKYVHRLHRLCETLLSLSKPLVAPKSLTSDANANAAIPAAALSLHDSDAPPVAASAMGTQDVMAAPHSDGSANGEFLTSTWNDDMMWQLFQSQPSLDWFNADILDPTWDFNGGK